MQSRLNIEPLETRLAPALTVTAFDALTGDVTFGQSAGFPSADHLVLSSSSGLLTHNLLDIGGVGDYADASDVDPGPGTATIDLALGGLITADLGDGSDTLSLDASWDYGAAASVSFLGGIGNDTFDLSAASASLTFTVASTNVGTVGTYSFHSAEFLKSGGGNDVFNFTSNASTLFGSINAGGGTDKLDYTGRLAAVTVNLGAGSAGGTGGIASIEDVTGGSGNDILIGSSANNVLDGGAGIGNDILSSLGGDDTLTGGDGLDILLGGLGVDSQSGGAGDDILVGGNTTYDSNVTALTMIQREWTRAGVPYLTRVGRIFGTLGGGFNGAFKLNATTVFDDGAVDSLTGLGGMDWSIVSTGDTDDNASPEIVTLI